MSSIQIFIFSILNLMRDPKYFIHKWGTYATFSKPEDGSNAETSVVFKINAFTLVLIHLSTSIPGVIPPLCNHNEYLSFRFFSRIG